MFLNRRHVAAFEQDGYVMLEGVFSAGEVHAMLKAVERGERVAGHVSSPEDQSGRRASLSIWHELGDDIWAAASTSPRIVNNIRTLLGEEISFFHGKVMLK